MNNSALYDYIRTHKVLNTYNAQGNLGRRNQAPLKNGIPNI